MQTGDHAARIARFALGAMNAAYETPIDLDDNSSGTVHIRVTKNSCCFGESARLLSFLRRWKSRSAINDLF